ncbi:MAG: outer membrane protein transport protein [Candidatus Omnitrophica bacterium]|nr:outer membrane protein transport protein [Candidatus Omnitrophota bacterium]
MFSRISTISIALFLVIFTAIPKAWALGSSGIENASYSAASLAQANAVVARPNDPDSVVYNAAGLPDLEGIQYSGGLAGIDMHTFFHSKVTGDEEKSTGQLLLIPNSYLTMNPGKFGADRLGFGVGLTSPFGLQNRYHSMSRMARYTGHHNYLNMVAVTIAGGLKVCDKFSVGGGAVDYIAYRYDQVFNFPNSALLQTAVPGNTFPDGLARVETNGSGWGWLASALLKPAKHHQLGVFYRSRATVNTNGEVKIENINPLLGATFPTIPNFVTGTQTEVPLPFNITVGYAYMPSDKWAVEFDWAYTGWHTFKDTDFAFDRPNNILVALGTNPKDFNDTWSFNLGGHYLLNRHVDLMGGAFFYTAASPKDHFTNVIPDSDRLGGTFGFRLNLDKKKKATLDFAYLALLYTRRSISNPGVFNKTGVSVDGRYLTFTEEFMVNFTYRFDLPFTKSEKNSLNVIKAVQQS